MLVCKYNEEELWELQNEVMVIYKIENLINKKVYIGQTVNSFNERYCGSGEGIVRVINSQRCNEHLYNSVNKYGVDNFKVSIIEKCKNEDELNEREIYYIGLYDSTDPRKGYNFCEGGNGGRRRISESQLYGNIVKRLKLKDSEKKRLDALIKKVNRLNVDTFDFLEEIGRKKIILIVNNEECYLYDSISHLIKDGKVGKNLNAIYCHFKKCEKELEFSKLYKNNFTNFEIYTLESQYIPSLGKTYIEQRQRNSELIKSRNLLWKEVGNILKDKMKKHGERIIYEEEYDYDYLGRPKKTVWYSLSEEQTKTVLNEFSLEVKTNHNSFYDENIKCFEGENGELSNVVFRMFRKYLKFE